MPEIRRPGSVHTANPWPLVLCLVGVDYFSTLAYLPSIAAEAAGIYAPIAAAGVVIVTFLLAIPVYWYVVGHAPDGRGATGMLEDAMPGWRGKIVVLTLLGFAAADFVITRSLSLADAAIHLLQNPHGQRLLTWLPQDYLKDDHGLFPPLEYLVHRLGNPQVVVTLALSILSFTIWRIMKRGISRRILLVTAAAVGAYLFLTAIVITSAIIYASRHTDIWHAWLTTVFPPPAAGTAAGANGVSAAGSPIGWFWPCLRIALWSFPQLALGLTGFEMIVNVVPRVSSGTNDDAIKRSRRARNTRKLMVTAAAIMAVYLISAVTITTLLVPRAELLPNGNAAHRALAYLAHGSPLADGATGDALNPIFGHAFGDFYDLSTAFILCLAGVSVTMGLQNLLPHYLNRLGMDVHWAGKSLVIVIVLYAVILLVTVVFRASPALQQWAYATSVLVLLTGAAFAAAKDLGKNSHPGFKRAAQMTLAAIAAGFFLTMTGLTVMINYSGLVIALCFVFAILVCSFVSRWIRCTELRFEGFEFATEPAQQRWAELCHSGPKILVPHRPGLISVTEKSENLKREYYLNPAVSILFIEVQMGDPSNFYQKPLMKIEREGDLEIIRLSHCVSTSHVLAALCLEMCRDNGTPPEIIFGWSLENPLAANLNFMLLGEGNIPWMVKELIRKAIPDPACQPRVRIG
jgi:hypothetical protein